jgi:hypothetical protein
MLEAKQALGEDVEIPEINDAITLAPSWQERRIGPQMIMACVALPVCKSHLEVNELSPAEQAVRNGRLLEGAPNLNA